MRFFFYFSYGLLPIWLNILYFFYALKTTPNDAAFGSMVLLMITLPLCSVTVLIAVATLAVKSRVPGDEPRKQIIAFAFCLLCTAAVVGLGLLDKYLRERDGKRIQLEERRVAELIKNDAAIRAAVHGSIYTSISKVDSRRTDSDYGVFASGDNGRLFAIVRRDSSTNPEGLTLICTTTVPAPNNLDASIAVCLRNQNRQGGSAIAR